MEFINNRYILRILEGKCSRYLFDQQNIILLLKWSSCMKLLNNFNLITILYKLKYKLFIWTQF